MHERSVARTVILSEERAKDRVSQAKSEMLRSCLAKHDILLATDLSCTPARTGSCAISRSGVKYWLVICGFAKYEGLIAMPIYEYVCTNCGLHFERHQRVSDDPIQVCPACDGQVRRVISPVGVIFKGSGFYVTDNRRSSSGSSRKPKPAGDTPSNGKADSAEAVTSKSESEKSPSEA